SEAAGDDQNRNRVEDGQLVGRSAARPLVTFSQRRIASTTYIWSPRTAGTQKKNSSLKSTQGMTLPRAGRRGKPKHFITHNANAKARSADKNTLTNMRQP